jgi:DNA-binding CsgD family transcriptional regulator
MLLPDPTKDLAWNLRRRERVVEAISPRELEYMRLVCDPAELTNKDIAGRMAVGVDRVDGYMKSLKKRFGVQSKQGLVYFAHAWDLVPQYPWGISGSTEPLPIPPLVPPPPMGDAAR